MRNSLSGPTSYDAPWNPLYTGMKDYPDQIGALRQTIAVHGVSHALIQASAGVRDIALKMPSFADTPHVECNVPMATMLPCGGNNEEGFARLCHLLAGLLGEYHFNEGDFRSVAGMPDFEQAVSLAAEIAATLGTDYFKVLVAAALVVEKILADHAEVADIMARQLLDEGFISSQSFAYHVRMVRETSFKDGILAALQISGFEEEIERFESLFA